MKKIKVFLTGAEGVGWALDTEYVLARQALSAFADVVDAEDGADVIHTVWPEATYWSRTLEKGFGGRPAIAALNNDPLAVARLPRFVDFARRHYCLVAQSSLARARFETLGFDRVPLVPIIADLESYFSIPRESPELDRCAEAHGIPRDRYLIGLLQRDSSGSDLHRFKVQKGPDVFLAILEQVVREIGAGRIHVVLGGPRRHWLRERLAARGIPFTFVGQVLPGDDHPGNILDKRTMNLLYNLLDLYLIPTRWEGAPRQVFDVAACRRKILSSRVGAAPDVLEPHCVYRDILEAAQRIVDDVRNNTLEQFVPIHHARIMRDHTPQAVSERWRALYDAVLAAPGARRGHPSGLAAHLARGWEAAARPGAAVARALRHGKGPRICELRLWQHEGEAPGAELGIGTGLKEALAAQGARFQAQDAAAAPWHLVDVGPGQEERLRRAIELPAARTVLVMLPEREQWPRLVTLLARDPRCVAVCACAADLGALAAASGGGVRGLVIPPFFEVPAASDAGRSSERPVVLAVPNAAIQRVLGEMEAASAPQLAWQVAVSPTPRCDAAFAQSLRGADVLVADGDTPYGALRLAQFVGVPVACDPRNPADEFGIGAFLEYTSIDEIPRLVRELADRRASFLEVRALPTAAETAQSLLAALGVNAGSA